jgi:hypothetical protein
VSGICAPPADARREAVRAATDPERVRALLQAVLDRSGSADRVESLSVQRLFYLPGVDFTVVYSATLRRGGQLEPAMLFGNIRYEDDAAALVAKSERKVAKGKFLAPRFGQPAYHLADLGMVLWTWPNDPKLKTLPAQFDAARVRAVLARLGGPDGNNGRWQIGASDRTLVRYIPRKRAVFRYEVEWRAARGADGAPLGHPSSVLQPVYAKLYDDLHAARQAYQIQETLWRGAQSDARSLRVPRPLHLDEEALVLYASALPGEHLSRAADRVGPAQVAGIARGLGLLQLTRLPVRATLSLAAELEKVREAARLVATVHPQFAAPLAALETSLAERLPALPRLPLVPCHGTFKLAHLLQDGSHVGLVDFDSVVLADPVYDVANFTADLHYLEVTGALPAGRAERLGRTLHDAWCNVVPWSRRDDVLDVMVASLLVRKQALKPVKHLHADAAAKIERLLRAAHERLGGGTA